jgi:hypothetical protein
MKIRVIHKTREGASFKVLLDNGQLDSEVNTLTWEDFNNLFEEIPGEEFSYKMTSVGEKAVAAIVNEKSTFFADVLPIMLSARAKIKRGELISFEDAMMIGGFARKYQEKFGGALLDFILEYKMFEAKTLAKIGACEVDAGSISR